LLEHGGRLREAARRYLIPEAAWLDLSTGINPLGWPVPTLPADCWRRLPEADDGLDAAACTYYGCQDILVTAGSQAAIQALPGLRPTGRVGVLAHGYAEHAHAWARGGHALERLAVGEIEAALDRLDVLVLINPNNPSGGCFAPATLLAWHRRLAARGGWLVVDEAFMDATPQDSLASHAGMEGLVVLRSLGKFFGLAGARVGFTLAWAELLAQLAETLGPWTVATPARRVARFALEDILWQEEARRCLPQAAARLGALLSRAGIAPCGGTSLFQWVATGRAAAIQDALAKQGILLRRFATPASLRFGLPGEEAQWQRLEAALQKI